MDKEAYDEEVTVWKTSDGREFDTEDAARAHAEEASVKLAGTKTYYKSSDGKEFATQAEAERHAADATVVVTVTGSETTWKTSDGLTFDTEDAARAHAAEASEVVTYDGETRVSFLTSDGEEFASGGRPRPTSTPPR